jgi:PilZ domain
MSGGNELRRAHRFPITTPCRWRVIGEAEWQNGRTINISSSGVFFRCPVSSDLGASMEMNVVLRNSGAKQAGLKVVCKGEVVRLECPPGAENQTAPAVRIAVKINDYHLLPYAPDHSNFENGLEGPENEK